MERLASDELAYSKCQRDFNLISSRGIVSQNKILKYYGFENYIGSPMGDRLFVMFRNAGYDAALSNSRGRQAEARFIDWDCFVRLTTIVIKGTEEERCRLIYGIFDRDKEGTLEKEEFVTIYMQLFKMLSDSKANFSDKSHEFIK